MGRPPRPITDALNDLIERGLLGLLVSVLFSTKKELTLIIARNVKLVDILPEGWAFGFLGSRNENPSGGAGVLETIGSRRAARATCIAR